MWRRSSVKQQIRSFEKCANTNDISRFTWNEIPVLLLGQIVMHASFISSIRDAANVNVNGKNNASSSYVQYKIIALANWLYLQSNEWFGQAASVHVKQLQSFFVMLAMANGIPYSIRLASKSSVDCRWSICWSPFVLAHATRYLIMGSSSKPLNITEIFQMKLQFRKLFFFFLLNLCSWKFTSFSCIFAFVWCLNSLVNSFLLFLLKQI